MAGEVYFNVDGVMLNTDDDRIFISYDNLITNGYFENWTAGVPDGWTTIDSGLDVTESTTIKHSGSKCASVDVITTSQLDTDFRQNIYVTGGTSYYISVWVYATLGTVQARLYIDGVYYTYSNLGIVGEWQEVIYNVDFPFIPVSDGIIDIGLRFYDQVGFPGSEVIYVDDFIMKEV